LQKEKRKEEKEKEEKEGRKVEVRKKKKEKRSGNLQQQTNNGGASIGTTTHKGSPPFILRIDKGMHRKGVKKGQVLCLRERRDRVPHSLHIKKKKEKKEKEGRGERRGEERRGEELEVGLVTHSGRDCRAPRARPRIQMPG